MKAGASAPFGAHLKALREAAGYTQEELATIAGLSVHAVSALERGQRRRPHVETLRALSAALDLTGATRDAFVESARDAGHAAVDERSDVGLPLALTALLGRDGEVQTLLEWLGDPTTRLITLVGPGGVGKTRLALEIARAISTQGTARVAFVSLAATAKLAFVASAIAEAFGLSDVTASDLPRVARVVCADRPTLLVLDNFEHLLDAAPLVSDLLISVASLQVLATSRAPLRVRGEREYAIGPLALQVDSDATADVTRSPALRLFVERVRDVRPDFRLTAANGPTVTAICRRLDALPLALELAAPWMKVLTPEDLLDRLAHDVLPSIVALRDVPERQQTINATVAWSYQLLDESEQRAFRRFGALPGLFPLDAAAAVLAGRRASAEDEPLRAVAGLIHKSLLARAETSVVATRPLYQMLETVRSFAALELAASGERDDALEGLVRYCTEEASLAASGLVGPAQVEWLDRVREDLESYRCALAWLIERGRSAEAIDIAWGLIWFWVIRGHMAEGLRWFEQALTLSSLLPAVEAKALLGAGMLGYIQGDLGRARSRLTRARAAGTGDMEIVVHTENTLGHVEYAAGHMQAARDCFARSYDGFRALGIPWGTGHALTALAWVALESGDIGQAERLLNEATPELRQAGPWFLSLARYLRALVAVQRGHPDEAIAWVRESLTHIRQLHDKFALVYALVPLAAASALKGDDAWSARILGAQDALTETTGARVVEASASELQERVEREARARLGPERWAQAYAAGRKSSIDVLLKDIDRARA